MVERRKPLIAIGLLMLVLAGFYAKILFTEKIIRAPDIINEYYWAVLEISKRGFLDFFNISLSADWSIYGNSGNTLLGGEVGSNLASLTSLIYYFIPPPASVGWFIVFHLFVGGCGVYLYCRGIGASIQASLLGGLIFAIAPEMASLVNAGHVLKIATISFAPWAFFFLEKGFQRRRLIFFMSTSTVLAFQFFNTHWQIAYYTCLSVGLYGIIRMLLLLREESSPEIKSIFKLTAMNLVTLCFFLSTVAISLAPLSQWSTDTNRGVQSGENSGKGGLNRDEAMSWSMPPEELAAFVVPGFFGFSRQEAGDNPTNIDSYYWGRMIFTQTTSYIGLLPWLLLPLPLLFRRDRYTLLAMVAVLGGIIFSMGKYTPVYNFLFDYFPGINRFRVPKMIMFLSVIGLGVMAARGSDLLRDATLRSTVLFRRYLIGIVSLPVVLLLVLASMKLATDQWLNLLYEMIIQPTRYEQGAYLIEQRWNNIITETAIASGFSAAYAVAVISAARGMLSARLVTLVLMAILLADAGRVNAKFMFLTDVPRNSRGEKSPVIDFLARQSNQYRVLPVGQDPAYYSSNNIPVLFTAMPVQQVRWQEVLDVFSLNSAIPDMLNLRYLVMTSGDYQKERPQLSNRYVPVFSSPYSDEIILENSTVLPKAWLVSSALVVQGRSQTLEILQNPAFDPRRLALVESQPPIPLLSAGQKFTETTGEVSVNLYEGERIELSATVNANSLLVLGEKYYKGWEVTVDGKETDIHPVNNILRGVYLTPGQHKVEFIFDPLPFKIGKWLTLASFALFAVMLVRERRVKGEG